MPPDSKPFPLSYCPLHGIFSDTRCPNCPPRAPRDLSLTEIKDEWLLVQELASRLPEAELLEGSPIAKRAGALVEEALRRWREDGAKLPWPLSTFTLFYARMPTPDGPSRL